MKQIEKIKKGLYCASLFFIVITSLFSKDNHLTLIPAGENEDGTLHFIVQWEPQNYSEDDTFEFSVSNDPVSDLTKDNGGSGKKEESFATLGQPKLGQANLGQANLGQSGPSTNLGKSSLRKFMDNAHATLGDTSSIRYKKRSVPELVAPQTEMQNLGLGAADHLWISSLFSHERHSLFQDLPVSELEKTKKDLEELLTRFNKNKKVRHQLSGWIKLGMFITTEKWDPKWYNPAHWKVTPAIKHFALKTIEEIKSTLPLARGREATTKMVLEKERQEKESAAQERARVKKEINKKISSISYDSDNFYNIVSQNSDSFGSLKIEAKDYSQNIVIATKNALSIASEFNQIDNVEASRSMAGFSSKLLDVGKKTICVLGWIGTGGAQAAQELSVSLGQTIHKSITDPVDLIKDAAESVYELGSLFCRATVCAVTDPKVFSQKTANLLKALKTKFDGLSTEQKVIQTVSCATKMLVSGLICGQGAKLAGKWLSFAKQSAVLANKEMQVFRTIKKSAKEFVATNPAIQKLMTPLCFVGEESKRVMQVAAQKGKGVARDLLDFVSDQKAIILNHGSVGQAVEIGSLHYEEFKKFTGSVAKFYKAGKGGGGGKAKKIKRTIKGLIKKEDLPTKGKIRYVPPKKFRPTENLPKKKFGGDPGFVDRFGNVWLRGPSRTIGEKIEWDVQLSNKGKKQLGWASKSGNHINVSLKGRITH